MPWTEETKAEAIEAYLAAEPTPENSLDIAKEVGEKYGQTVNSARMMLSKAGVYVAKTPATAKAATSGGTATKPTRVSKEDSQSALTAAIEGLGKKADSEIISKLTGKAAVYFTGILEGLSAAE